VVLGTATAIISAGLLLASSEVLLRLEGYAPWERPVRRQPVMHEPDPVLGWRAKPGTWEFQPYAPEGRPFRVTIHAGGRRATSRAGNPDGRPLVLVGGSFTEGAGVADEETYAWRLQEHLPELRVLNYGTAAYGTYQSLLMLEEVLPGLGDPAAVIYGVIGHHKRRNGASPTWLEIMTARTSASRAGLPWVSLDGEGRLVREPLLAWPTLPGRHLLATVAFAERMWVEFEARDRGGGRRRMRQELTREMAELASRYGAAFAAVILSSPPREVEELRSELRDLGIRTADCAFELTPELQVPGDVHPNGEMHARYAECIRTQLGDVLRRAARSDAGAFDRAPEG
jgi:hypothetical protein